MVTRGSEDSQLRITQEVLKQTELVVEVKGESRMHNVKHTKKINCGAKYNYPSENCTVSITSLS